MITLTTQKKQELIDITHHVQEEVSALNVHEGLCHVYTPHATAAIIVTENYDPNICIDLLTKLDKLVPLRDNYLHDKVDGNAAAHLKASLLGPGEVIPIEEGKLLLGQWQSIMFAELDGPRSGRKVIVKVSPAKSNVS
jgi:secondary thiamine-phosphate synthase enzyme